ncbi:hypothetical protein HanPSC8_Chr09g0355141 [Helianthus annuus]|nr:hypothetical protein HanPSC8_Chr09g0355141 [Helianthus annuus]
MFSIGPQAYKGIGGGIIWRQWGLINFHHTKVQKKIKGGAAHELRRSPIV